MKPIGANIITLFADLQQSVRNEPTRAVSVHTKTVSGQTYYYAKEKIGSQFKERSLGPASDPAVKKQAKGIIAAGERARTRRKTVTLIKNAGIAAPSFDISKTITAISEAGLFSKGVVLIGTGAYQVYPCLVGAELESGSLTTQDVDIAVATVAIKNDVPLLDVLKNADPTFRSVPGLKHRDLAKKFTTAKGFEVEVLTPVRRRDEKSPVPIKGLSAGASPLQYLAYLIADAVPTIALIEGGMPVTVPQPARYAVHKLIVAQVRKVDASKRKKDLKQAKELIEAIELSDPMSLEDAFYDARKKGRGWAAHIDASLRELGMADRF
jgi:hypothetical protein